MAETTGISWTHSTFNPWIGCTKVGPGCDHCYAETEDARRQWGGSTHWGAGKPRHKTSAAYWKNPYRWNALATGEHRVFCASLADVFDNEVPQEWRDELWALVEATPNLTWQLLTKRIGNVMGMVPEAWSTCFPDNVWMGMTCVTQAEYDRDIVKLDVIPARVLWLSLEPQIEHIYLGFEGLSRVNWVVTGGESGSQARPYNIEWARSIIRECREAAAAPFVKQLGRMITDKSGALYSMTGKAGDPAEWPEDLRVQEFPQNAKLGKSSTIWLECL